MTFKEYVEENLEVVQDYKNVAERPNSEELYNILYQMSFLEGVDIVDLETVDYKSILDKLWIN